jgi:hypothetical protein
MSFLKKLRLTRPEDQRLLDEDLALLDLLASQIKTQEARIKAASIADADTALIASIPGMGQSFRRLSLLRLMASSALALQPGCAPTRALSQARMLRAGPSTTANCSRQQTSGCAGR